MLPRFALAVLSLTLLLPVRTFAQGGKDSPLHAEMEGMNRSLKLIGRQYTDPAQKASTLELVATMQKHAETARTMTPPKLDKMSPEDQAKTLDTFHKDLNAVINEIDLLKAAISADNSAVAKAEIDKLKQLKESGHKDLGVGDDHHHGGPPPPAGR